jgi:UDP-glucose:(glucosyl)LPS alpha-1,2-glucosyltransferase/UDP-N-acetylglucosamine:(glucosyl)LPS alpha-1,2-N-acetylglucosaminyltransferase
VTPHILCTWAPGYALDEIVEGVTFHRIRIGRIYKRLFQKITRLDPWGYHRRAAAYIERISAAIVHVHNDPDLFRKLRTTSRDPRRRYILHLHNERTDLCELEHAELIVVSEYLRDWYQARLPCARIYVVTNGVDLEEFNGHRASAEERARLLPGLDPSLKKIVLYAGRISPEKGPLDLVRAMSHVMTHRKDIGLVLVGEYSRGGRNNRRAQYGELVRAAMDALPEGHALSLGSVSPEYINRIYVSADLVVMPSVFNEPLGMVALEAMASETLLLAARKGGLREIVREGETGFFIPEGGEMVLAQRILSLLEPDPHINTIVRNARAYVMRRHDWNDVAASVERMYERL